MKHLSHHTIAIIVALLSTLSLALAVISLPHQAYAVDGTDGTKRHEQYVSGKRRRFRADRRTGAQHHHHQLRVWR